MIGRDQVCGVSGVVLNYSFMKECKGRISETWLIDTQLISQPDTVVVYSV